MPDDVVNARGELTFAEQTRLLYTPQGTERLTAGVPVPSIPAGHKGVCGLDGPLTAPVDPAAVSGYRATPDDDEWYDAGPGPGVLPVQWWQGVHPAHVDDLPSSCPGPLPEGWYRR